LASKLLVAKVLRVRANCRLVGLEAPGLGVSVAGSKIISVDVGETEGLGVG
jgi:hypothetical protein